MTLTEKVAHLKGRLEEVEQNTNSKELSLIKELADIMEDIAYSIADVEDEISELSEQTEMIDEDLEALENDYYEFDEDDEDDECGGCCGCDDDCCCDDFCEVTCPACGETICVDMDDIEDGEMNCPNCGELLEFTFEDEDEDEEEDD